MIGKGAMGSVFAAYQRSLGRRVAIKFLAPEAATSPDAHARFEREARAAAAIQSEHVVRVIDVGRHVDGCPYIVMELLSGEDLATTLRRHGPLPVDVATKYVVEACSALGLAHALGIVHRDIKPANLFLARRAGGHPVIKILDFGISKTTRGPSGDATLTTASTLLGSPAYMAPEQLREAHAVDGRADIWALGVTLYELTTGRRPFETPTIAELNASILTARPEPPRALLPAIPHDLERVILRCLEKESANRFGSIGELAAALEGTLRGATPVTVASPAGGSARALRRAGIAGLTLVAGAFVVVASTRRASTNRTPAGGAAAVEQSAAARETAAPGDPPGASTVSGYPASTAPMPAAMRPPQSHAGPAASTRRPPRSAGEGRRATSESRSGNPLDLEIQ